MATIGRVGFATKGVSAGRRARLGPALVAAPYESRRRSGPFRPSSRRRHGASLSSSSGAGDGVSRPTVGKGRHASSTTTEVFGPRGLTLGATPRGLGASGTTNAVVVSGIRAFGAGRRADGDGRAETSESRSGGERGGGCITACPCSSTTAATFGVRLGAGP